MRAAVFNGPHAIEIAELVEAYRAMDERRVIKALLRIGTV